MKVNKSYTALALSLAALLLSGIGCHLLLPLGPVNVSTQSPYMCTAQIYRDILGGTHQVTEEWELHTWPTDDYGVCTAGNVGSECTSNQQCGENGVCNNDGLVTQADAYKDCEKKLNQYIQDFMAPGFTWSYANLTAVQVAKKNAIDCETGVEPPSYGAPFGAELRWNYPSEINGSVYISFMDNDGVLRAAEPGIANAYLDFADRTGLPQLLPDGLRAYVPGKRHIRFSDIFIELDTPFQLGDDMTITKCYIQSIGTVVAEYDGGIGYSFYPGGNKFYFYGSGEKEGEGATTSFCFSSETSVSGLNVNQGGLPSFTFALTLSKDLSGRELVVRLSLSSPSGQLFNHHQPYVDLLDKEVKTTTVTLAPVILIDNDDNLDEFRLFWFKDYEDPLNEELLGVGQSVPDVELGYGEHRITLLAYDTYGAYGSDTMTLKITNVAPVALDDDYTVKEDQTLDIAAPGVLANDSDENGEPLTAELLTTAAHGALSLNPDGSFTYTPAPNWFGVDTLTYKAFDGSVYSGAAIVTITVEEVTPEQETQSVIDLVNALVDSQALNAGQGNSLISKLDAVISALSKSNKAVACNLLKAFINQVQSLVTDGVLSSAEAQPLLDKVNNLQSELGC